MRRPILGAAAVNAPRPDLGAAFGSLHATDGYGFVARGLAPGTYTIAVLVHSTVVPAFTIAQPTRVQVVDYAQGALDTPSAGAEVGQGFVFGGWAADFDSSSGGGVDVVHVWGHPLDRAGDPIMLWAASVVVPRPDVGAFFGAQFGVSGFILLVPPLPVGAHRVVALADRW